MSLNALLSMASNALLRTQVALSITGHNVTNVNTEGFSRQRVSFASELPITTSEGQVGTGVQIESIQRQVNTFLIEQTNKEMQSYYRWEAESQILDEVETILMEDEEFGINKSLNDFWDAWADVANEPSGATERAALVSAARSLADTFNSRVTSLNTLRSNLDSRIRAAVTEINDITENIAQLNTEIKAAEANPNVVANDLRDKRDELVDKLAEYVDLDFFESPVASGGVEFSVVLSDGKPLVTGSHSWSFSTDDVLPDSQYSDVKWVGAPASKSVIPTLQNGKLYAWLQLRDETIPEIVADLDSLAASLTNEVNKLHVTGYGLDGSSGNRFFETCPLEITQDRTNEGSFTVEGSVFNSINVTLDDYTIEFVSTTEFRVINQSTGEPLADPDGGPGDYLWTYTSGSPIRFDGLEVFITDGVAGMADPPLSPQAGDILYVSSTKGAASNMAVASEVLADTDKIAAGETPESGDNGMAQRIRSLQNESVMEDGTLTFETYFSEAIAQVGVWKQEAQTNEEHYDIVVSQLTTYKLSVSGVSLDEEMTNLIKFQYAFQATSKLVTVADEVLETLMDILKR